MPKTADFWDMGIVLRRIRNWEWGMGRMRMSSLLYQMGGRPSNSPYGWREDRIRSAVDALVSEGALRQREGLCGPELEITEAGSAKYEEATICAIQGGLRDE